MSALNRSKFKFLKHDSIGAEGAEQDIEYLQECFVDTGDLAVLRDTKDARRIVVGRTGAGKSALLLLLARKENHVATIEPEQLSLNYLSNSTILPYLESLGVNLDVFYRLLWRHVLIVELIQVRYGLRSEKDKEGFFFRIRELLRGDKRKEVALKYLEEWGESFWKDTEFRIHQITDKFENDIRSKLGAQAPLLTSVISGGASHSREEVQEIKHRAQEVVNAVQIQQLSRVVDILAEEVFSDPQQRFFIIIDRLDENWVSANLRYKLIRALIETVKDLQRIANTKVVVAMRHDLLQRVFRETRDAGFQEEKYQALYLPLHWNRDSLLDVLDSRLQRLVGRRYSGVGVTWRDLFPRRVLQRDTGEYITERTLFRPRDIIQFCNCCIELATDKPEISAQMLKDAESTYSTLRYRGLGDEWAADYPELLTVAEVLQRRLPLFPVSEITLEQLDGLCVSELESAPSSRLKEYFQKYYDKQIDETELRRRVVFTFYEVGLIGLKLGTSAPISWSFKERDVLRSVEIRPDTRVAICPVFYRVLGAVLRPGH